MPVPDLRDLPFVADDPELTQILVRVKNASIKAASTFVPGLFHGKILLIRAETREPSVYRDQTMGWSWSPVEA